MLYATKFSCNVFVLPRDKCQVAVKNAKTVSPLVTPKKFQSLHKCAYL